MAGKAFVIGNGQFNIDWVSVEDVAAAHVLAERALNATSKTVRGQVYNVGCFQIVRTSSLLLASALILELFTIIVTCIIIAIIIIIVVY